MDERLLESVVGSCLRQGCSEAEALSRRGATLRLTLEAGRATVDVTRLSLVTVRVSCDGRLGRAVVSADGGFSADLAADLAVRAARANPSPHGLPRLCPTSSLPAPEDVAADGRAHANRWREWLESESPDIGRTFGCELLSLGVNHDVGDTALYNSNGARGRYGMASSMVMGVAQRGSAAPPVFFACHGVRPGDGLVARLRDEGLAERLAWSATPTRAAGDLRGWVRFGPRASAQLALALAQSLSGELILFRRSFLRREDLGRSLWSPELSLSDDPLAPGAPMRPLFDAEGIPAERRPLIRDGVAVGVLCDLAAHARLGAGRPGNAFPAPFGHETQVCPTNLTLDVRAADPPECEVYIDELGMQAAFDVTTGTLTGILCGQRTERAATVPVSLAVKAHINDLLRELRSASEPVWTGTVRAPALAVLVG